MSTSLSAIDQGISSSKRPTVHIVENEPETRHSLSCLVRGAGLAVEIYADAKEFLCACEPELRGCLVLDACLPRMSGIELQRALLARGIGLPVIFISADGDIAMAAQAIRAGAVDFIQKPFPPSVMLDRIEEAMRRDEVFHQRRSRQQELATRLGQLSKRETEVMRLLIEGASTKSIARQLEISSKTVDNHRVHILEKVRCANTVELTRLVYSTQVPVVEPCILSSTDIPLAAVAAW
jgi:FixJ family two-component response regulator